MTQTSNGDEVPFYPICDKGETLPPPTQENTLYLPIRQVYFDQIIAGTKDREYREIKGTTYKKYLKCDDYDDPYYFNNLVDINELQKFNLIIYNNGIYPYVPRDDIKYLNLAVGYQKERDTAIVEVKGAHFEPIYGKDGKAMRYSINPSTSKGVSDPNGPISYWQIVFHLGKVVELHRK